jgi:hypothetical protein
MKEGGEKAMNISDASQVSRSQRRVLANFMSIYMRPSIYTPALTWKPLKTTG